LIILCLAFACSKEEAAPKKETPAPQPLPAEAVKGRRVDIAVKKTGYDPPKVDVKAGEEVTLVFTMLEESECGREVVIPDRNVKETLTLNKPVAIPFKADAPGSVRFACGMDMMRGAIVVTAN
jgi:plastocyanin domain-containing protein